MCEDDGVESSEANAKLLWEMHDNLEDLEETEDIRRLKDAYLILAKHFEYKASQEKSLSSCTHPTRPGRVRRYHLYPDGARYPVPGAHNGLV